MKHCRNVTAVFFVLLLAAANAFAQTGGVSLKPLLKPGQEARYSLSGSIDTQVTAAGANGLSGSERREMSATLLLRVSVPAPPGANKNIAKAKDTTIVGTGLPHSRETFVWESETGAKEALSYEAVIEAFDLRRTINGADSPSNVKSAVGQKIAFSLDAAGRVVKCAIPVEAAREGLADLLFSMLGWAPAAPLAVGQTWTSPAASDPLGYGYISATAMSSVPKYAKATYTLSALDGGRAVVEGAITLQQEGASMLPLPAVQPKVNLIAAGRGTTRIEYDTATSRLASAMSESVLKGKVVNIPPTLAGEKMQPREGALTETAKFSIKLVQ